MRKLILFAVFWQVLNVSAYTHSGNPTASGVMPQVGHCAVDKIIEKIINARFEKK